MAQCVTHTNSYLSNFAIFLQVRIITRSGLGTFQAAFISLGDSFLNPVRYFFHGRDVQIILSPQGLGIHHVASYHENSGHCSRTSKDLFSSEKSWWKATIFVALFIPGLILGVIVKGLAFLFLVDRLETEVVNLQMHFTKQDVTCGDSTHPLTRDAVLKQLEELRKDPFNQKIHTLTLYTTENFFVGDFLDRLDVINSFNPKKIILIGGRVINSKSSFVTTDSFSLPATSPQYGRIFIEAILGTTKYVVKNYKFHSIQQARDFSGDSLRDPVFCSCDPSDYWVKPYHMILELDPSEKS